MSETSIGDPEADLTQDGQTMTHEYRVSVVSNEIIDLQKDTENLKCQRDQDVELFRALLEELDYRVQALEQAAHTFKREVQKSWNFKSNTYCGETTMRWYENQSLQRDICVQKTLIKNAQYNRRIQGLTKKLGKRPTDIKLIDYQMLEIEKELLVQKTKEAAVSYTDLKKKIDEDTSRLDVVSSRLKSHMKEHENLQYQKERYERINDRLSLNIDGMKTDIHVLTREQKKYRLLTRTSAEIPHIMDLIHKKREQKKICSR